MQTLGFFILKFLFVVAYLADLIATQDAEILFQSSSNFKAMEGISFDMTCQVNDSGNHSIELFLPNGKRADNNDYATIGPPSWSNYSVELKIMKAVKSRDEGLYKCVVNGSHEMENSVEFILEPFLNLSTPNANIKVGQDTAFVINFASLPSASFYIMFGEFHPNAFHKNNFKLMPHGQFQVSPNQLRMPAPSKPSKPFAANISILAYNTKFTSYLFFDITTEGKPLIEARFASPVLYNNEFYETKWNETEVVKLFHPFEFFKIDYFYRFKEFKKVSIAVTMFADPIASVIAWMFQPCFNMTSCTPLEELDENAMIGGRKSPNKKEEMDGIAFYPDSPGYLYLYAENALGFEMQKIALNFGNPTKISIITENVWNPYLERNEIAIGEDLVLECQAVFYDDITWRIGDYNITHNTSKYVVKDIQKSKHMNIQRMEIKNMTKNEYGNYSCSSTLPGTDTSPFGELKYESHSQNIFEIEKIPPKVNSNFNNNVMIRKVGEFAYLECSIEGMSIRNFTWHKDGQLVFDTNNSLIESSLFKISLTFNELTGEDAGNYSCVAMNNFGRDEHFVAIKFQDEKHIAEENALVFIGILFLLSFSVIILYIRIRMANNQILELKAAGLANFEEGNLESFNKLLGLNEQADLLPYDPRFEFPVEKLTLQEQLGSGAFGVVYKAIAKEIKSVESETIVAVKTINKLAPNEMLKALVVELKIMVHMGQHLNIINLLGAITKNIAKRDLMVISEYCCHGDLQGFLRTHRSSFKNIDSVNTLTTMSMEPSLYVNVRNNSIDNLAKTVSFNTSNLISWSFQVACGMDYLASKKVLHGDLAARNVLLCSDHIVKISDFGLAKSLYQNYVYQRKDDALLPYKWLALECLIDNTFSVYSDIWAYGILVWEIFTLGQSPYPEIFGIEPLLNKLQSGYRLTKPEFSSNAIYEIMLDCWNKQQMQRPSFVELEQRFGDKMTESSKKNLLDLNEPFIKANHESIRKGRIDLKSLWEQESDDELERNQPEGSENYKNVAMANYSKPKVIQ